VQHFNVGDMVRVVGYKHLSNSHLNGHEGRIVEVMTDVEGARRLGMLNSCEVYGFSVYAVEGVTGPALGSEPVGAVPGFALGHYAENLKRIYPPADGSFKQIVKGLTNDLCV
jgi:hypothetical protein